MTSSSIAVYINHLHPPNSFAPSTITQVPTKITTHLHPSSCSVYCKNSSSLYWSNKREHSPRLPSSVASVSCPPLDAGALENEFGGQGQHGVSFSDISDSCVVRMAMENGSVARLMLPSGLITSYKALMWHGGTMELLHTSVSEGENGEAIIHGGVSLDFKCDIGGVLWSPNTWLLQGVKGSPQESIQVELSSKKNAGSNNNVEVKHIITLTQDVLRSEIVVCNSSASSFHFTGAIISHLTVSTPEATYAIGLEGSDFINIPPVSSEFSLVHPSFGKTGSKKHRDFMELLSSWGVRNTSAKKYDDGNERTKQETQEILEGEEEDNFKILEEKMSRIYTSAPRSFTILDRVLSL